MISGGQQEAIHGAPALLMCDGDRTLHNTSHGPGFLREQNTFLGRFLFLLPRAAGGARVCRGRGRGSARGGHNEWSARNL